MKRWYITGGILLLVLAAATVFAFQSKTTDTAAVVAQEVAAKPAAATGSGCGGAGGCGQSAGCGGAGGGCGGGEIDPAASAQRIDSIKSYLATYYQQKRGLSNVSIEVEDFGCHQEATVVADGRVIDRLSISGNSITRIEG